MNWSKRWGVRALGLVVGVSLMVGLIASASRPAPDPAVREGMTKLANLLEKKDTEAVDKLIAELSKKPTARSAMHMMNPMVGEAANKGVTDKDLADRADAYKEAGYQAAAIGAIIQATGKEADKKKQADWEAYSKELQEAGLSIVEAASKKDGSALKASAMKAGGACGKCHESFRPWHAGTEQCVTG